MSDIREDREYWDRQARRDPLWAILSEQTRRDGTWDVASFFQTGATEIASMDVVRAGGPR
ncbi:MAG TPA: hypothetical protein VKE96_26590 [Vicinamibacterales bacterium]|nr:hypothetical protein [Vicinamibacterales bacterium]